MAELEGEPFEDDDAWFAEQQEGMEDKRMAKWIIILIVCGVVIILLAISVPIICCIWCCKRISER